MRIPPTAEQLDIDAAQMRVVELDRREDHKRAPGWSSELERLEDLFDELAAEEARKIVLFSEWTTMLTLIEQRIARFDLHHARLDGSVPQKRRQLLVHRFQHDPTCRLFLTTNAGSTGLNLQAANTVINIDLPWNPAVLEQRIARAHRMGQRKPVRVYLLVTEETIAPALTNTRDEMELWPCPVAGHLRQRARAVRTAGTAARQRKHAQRAVAGDGLDLAQPTLGGGSRTGTVDAHLANVGREARRCLRRH